ncbi:UDP-N-acetylglucosamine 1-carboxyvinyltransferase [Anaerocolumna cellulosilytica]|uniref:UDP-N-acetylglucosamine 1-carboxyvinyltransferase n=1 Tax=Anaerocolumna cellulosilytica TaxID=433286 RepID=A0A6S6R5A2_9FIRM|nr:UDP-N-acetylglucosamine 1-carboxyvinyltransferase [Anaerocolumna cellulosilytica]MBB5197054.1 UDP-N-acetylglucosamine 1-carboxyvinyltransferase [Anaerocolumna cellulosilytica]BCJ95267.1 UDP-N-acetylglucosamine 1-carboxyvinyltransferase [Anaerocolumna cellulosilytica]
MAFIEIVGGKQLNGEVNIQGSKNAVLPILAATVLVNGITKLNHCPKILDVYHMIKILEAIGCSVQWENSSLLIDTTKLHTSTVPEEYVKMMRSSVILMGALLGRTHSVTITYPGGCTIGARPIDYHLSAFKDLNVQLEEEDGLIQCTTKEIKGNNIQLQFPSVGATENVILAAVLATGKTRIFNAAKEPEIIELCKFLNASGARIYGAGTERIEIDGVDYLHPVEYTAASDRIVAGTYLAAVAGTGGEAVLTGIGCGSLHKVVEVLRQMGCSIYCGEDYIIISSSGRLKSVPSIQTAPYPGFPTDMQSQIMSVLTIASGDSIIKEEIFEGRYQNVEEQLKFGADIRISGREASIHGVSGLTGCEVYASELRGGAALVIAGLMANGKTTLHNPYFIERGYENICRDLKQLGADINYRT